MSRRTSFLFALLLPATMLAGSPTATAADPALVGAFSAPFAEPTINGVATADKCLPENDAEGNSQCKPAAGSIAVLRDGRVLYFNALEDTEDIEYGIAAEYGAVSVNDQTRVLDLDVDAAGNIESAEWAEPTPVDGGANPAGNDSEPLLPGGVGSDIGQRDYNDGSLFCADLTMLPDGRILAAGGTDYYSEPSVPGTKYGVVELEGLKESRIFDPQTNTWTSSGAMAFGRWYPILVTLADGDVFVASGVTKLMKPLYPNRPADSGTNVKQTETYDVGTGTWSSNGAAAAKSLPLFPRLHLLPNGDVFFNSGGQTFNPQGQSYDEALWNMASVYDPDTRSWRDLGVPGLGTPSAGFRGSSFSVMLPLQPNPNGSYTRATFIAAGGVIGTTPGLYVATPFSLETTVNTAGGTSSMTSRAVGDLRNRRWYSTAVALPTGNVLTFSGANADEVVFPGSAMPVTQVESYDPATGSWTALASQNNARTYHNTAVLLPDGRVLVGGHAPISTGYGANMTAVPGVTSPNDGRDPSFEIFSPPYLFKGDRPEITSTNPNWEYGRRFTVATDDAGEVQSVALVRRPTLTHLIDADQRTVMLPFDRVGNTLRVDAPPNGAVAPPGQYMLFVNGKAADGSLIPSESVPVALS